MKCRKCRAELQPKAEGDELSGFKPFYYGGKLIFERPIVAKVMKLACDNCGAEYVRNESGSWELSFEGSGDLVTMMKQVAQDPYAFVPREDGNPLFRVMDEPEHFPAIPAEEPDEEEE